MKSLSKILPAAGLVLAMASTAPAFAQQPAAGQQPPKASAACLASARELLAMKNVSAMYVAAVPNIVEQAKNRLLQANLNYQKDLNESALVVAKVLAGREKEIGEGMANIYCAEFTDQEVKDLVTFYKTPLGQKLLTAEPKAIQTSMSYMQQWAMGFADIVTDEIRAEMKKRGKPI